MTVSKAFMNLTGAMDVIKMSKNPLAPFYEAITNSLEALSQIRNRISSEIEVQFRFTGLFDDRLALEQVEIIDNGAGFNEENYNRFREFFDKSKGYDNRGTGRLQYFHRFQRVEIDSTFESNEKYYRRVINCNKLNFIVKETLDEVITESSKTIVALCDYSASVSEAEYFTSVTIDEITKSIKSHFLLRLYLDNKKDGFKAPTIKISFFKKDTLIEERIIDPESIPSPKRDGDIKIPYMKVVYKDNGKSELEEIPGFYEVVKWAHFALPESELGKNGIYLCSKDIPVQSFKFERLKKGDTVKGHRFLTAFYGNVLDESSNVSDSVDSFTFPERKDIEARSDDLFVSPDEKFILFDSISEQVNNALPEIYSDIMDVEQELHKDIESIAKAHGIPTDVIKEAKIGLNDTEITITKKLYKTQSEGLAEKSFKAKRLFESLSGLDPTEKNYQKRVYEKSVELSELVEQQNKEELSRYVIRREMVTEILRKILLEELDYQKVPKVKGKNKNREALIHDLVFKRKGKSTNSLNDLWILNEEFMHFDGCSDLALNEIKTPDGQLLLKDVPPDVVEGLNLKLTRRPDIFLYPSEEKCLLVEFKEPNVDLSNYLQQLPKYCTLIANFSQKKFTTFHCYLIGENFNKYDLDGDYKETVNGDWIKPNTSIVSIGERNTIANAQVEIIKLSSIHARAHRRNKSFAEKLGIPDLLQDDHQE